ncbi:hypothetical protein [Allostreptomyces psammosilenae]|uniref:Transketolase n=1 Tax=Allostreptomyces psammosilenae TaxID=1892865 RepID=A0A852ZQ17_9ACTN|nr:hypothetical protein [Allostreptomyces psammosilenae]NYI03587.1 transketolase [Allostreptomyces psammosilenae]
MDPVTVAGLASAASTALVAAMVTDGWQRATGSIAGLWRRARPEQAEVVEAELVETREEMVRAREAGEDVEEARQEAVDEWQGRLRRLLRQHPELAAELRRVLDEEINPLLPGPTSAGAGVVMHAEARDHGRIYMAGRDQTINER